MVCARAAVPFLHPNAGRRKLGASGHEMVFVTIATTINSL
jgi:hypothetical protein